MKKILIVDDEKEIVSIIQRNLESSGYSVISAGSGKEAINSAKTENPDLIVLDLVLPDAEELDAANALKEDAETSSIPVIYVSGLLSKEEAEDKGYFSEGSVFLAKPFNKEELLSAINKLLS